MFNRPVVPLMMSGDQADLPNPLSIVPETAGQGEWLNTSVYVFRPDEALIGRASYNVTGASRCRQPSQCHRCADGRKFSATFSVAPPTFDFLELVGETWQPSSGYERLPLDQTYRLHFISRWM